MYDVFISYSRKDTKVIDRICEELKKQGITFFIDRKGISGGMEFPEIIVDAIENSRIFLFVGSKNSYTSRYAVNEVTYMYNTKGKNTILPYMIDDTPLPKSMQFIFGSVNYRNIHDHPIKTVLISDIKSMLSLINGDSPVQDYDNYKNQGKTQPAHPLFSYLNSKHWIINACVLLQIAILFYAYGVFFFLFQKGFIANPPHHIVWWTNVVLTTSVLLSICGTALLLWNKKTAFYSICALDVIQAICISLIANSVYHKLYDYKSVVYSTLSDIGESIATHPVAYIFIVFGLILLHCSTMWAVLQIKKNGVSAWSQLK